MLYVFKYTYNLFVKFIIGRGTPISSISKAPSRTIHKPPFPPWILPLIKVDMRNYLISTLKNLLVMPDKHQHRPSTSNFTKLLSKRTLDYHSLPLVASLQRTTTGR